MIRETIICVIFITLITFGDAVSKVNHNNLINGNSRNLSQLSVIRKCCPFGQYVQRTSPLDLLKKQCAIHSQNKNFSTLKVYDKDIYDTGKLFDEVFTISDGMFVENIKFRNQAINVEALEIEPYLIEDGSLQMQLRNAYPQWTPVTKDNFCIDYAVTSKNLTSRFPKFWTVIESNKDENRDEYLTGALLVSCVFMVLVLLVYGLLPELQNLCGLILMAYVASLCIAFMLLTIMQLVECLEEICIFLSFGIYYSFLASFCWMNVMSYDIWWTFRGYAKARPIHRRGERFKFLMYCLYAFGVPLLMSILLAVLNWIDMKALPWFITPNLLKEGCFIEGMSKMLYLYTPLLVLNLCNWVFFLMTAFNLWRMNRATAILDSAAAGTPAAHRTHMHRFVLYLKLTVVMGLNWLLEVVSFIYPKTKYWYVTDVYNCLIGLIIFVIFVCKKKIFRKLYRRYALRNTMGFHAGSSKSYSRSSSKDSHQITITLQKCCNPEGTNDCSITRNA